MEDLFAHELGFQSIIGSHLLSIVEDPEHVVIHQQAHLVANLPGKFFKPGNSIHPLPMLASAILGDWISSASRTFANSSSYRLTPFVFTHALFSKYLL